MASNGMSKEALAAAGNEKYAFSSKKQIAYPEGETVIWHGYIRHNFELEGCKGFIVEPPHPAPGLPWSWCLQWAEAFVPRTPALQLLDRGFHHVHIDVFETYMNDKGIKIVEKFEDMLQKLHFNKKAALIGMSYGGLFSWRWTAEHPETVGAMYLDAPVCTLAFCNDYENRNIPQTIAQFRRGQLEKHIKAYGVSDADGLKTHPKDPLNNYQPIAKAKIPTLVIRNGQDMSVVPETNIDIMEKLIREAGGDIEIIDRPLYGHHPHGMDDPTPLTGFILRNYPDFEI